jgi:hypothetical protein
MLPIHPQPQPKEILSSWMVRLAMANGFPLHTFYANLLGFKSPIWNRDIDRHPSCALLDLLSRQTGQSLSVLDGLTLKAYGGILFEELPMIGNAPWILPLGIFHRIHRRAGMQFCPLCLQLDTICYYRRCWRLSIYSICEHHHCVMQEYCPSCHAPVAYHRHGIGRNVNIPAHALRLCHQCKFDLRKAVPTYFNWPDTSSWATFTTLISDFEQESRNLEKLPLPCGVMFFEGLYVLISLVRGRNGERLRQRLKKELGLDISNGVSANQFEFEFLNATDRLKLLLSVIWLLEDWPVRFATLCLEVGITRSRLSEKVQSLPFWLTSMADEYLDHRPYCVNEDEILAAGTYLVSQNKEVTPSTLKDLLGVAKEVAGNAWHIWKRHHL